MPLLKVGQKFGKLTVIKVMSVKWVACKCNCPNKTIIDVRSSNLVHNHTRSCGCLRHQSIKHGMSDGPEHKTWMNMHKRCKDTNKNSKDYKKYYKRGIRVCKHWSGYDGFVNFYRDLGPKPSYEKFEYSIDRIDGNDGYHCGKCDECKKCKLCKKRKFKTNCRWATQIEQARNEKSNRYFIINGRRECLATWIEIYTKNGKCTVQRKTIEARLKRGMDIVDALRKPNFREMNLYTVNGITGSRAALARHFKIGLATVLQRIRLGWTIREALITPVIK